MKEVVLSAILGERHYQDEKWPHHQHSVAEWLLIMEKLMGDARKAWVTGHGDNSALHEIRQVVATGVACMEQCGAPLRGEPVTGRVYANEGGLAEDIKTSTMPQAPLFPAQHEETGRTGNFERGKLPKGWTWIGSPKPGTLTLQQIQVRHEQMTQHINQCLAQFEEETGTRLAHGTFSSVDVARIPNRLDIPPLYKPSLTTFCVLVK